MRLFEIKVRTTTALNQYQALAPSAASAFQSAADTLGDTPGGITVTPVAAQ